MSTLSGRGGGEDREEREGGREKRPNPKSEVVHDFNITRDLYDNRSGSYSGDKLERERSGVLPGRERERGDAPS